MCIHPSVFLGILMMIIYYIILVLKEMHEWTKVIEYIYTSQLMYRIFVLYELTINNGT